MVDIHITTRREFGRIIKWDNPIAIADGYSVFAKPVNGKLIGQFAFAPIYLTDVNENWEGTWSANSMATLLSNPFLRKIVDLQIPDEYSVAAKMNWLLGYGTGLWGSPMTGIYSDGSRWMDALDIRMIVAAYANQLVEILEHRVITVNFNGKVESIPMSRIRTFRAADWGKTFITDPYLIQKVTAVTDTNTYQENPKGAVYLPLYVGNRRAWIFDRWYTKE